MTHRVLQALPLSVAILSTAAVAAGDNQNAQLRQLYDQSKFSTDDILFPQEVVGDPVAGRGIFGLGTGPVIDPYLGGIFQGTSVIYGPLVSNGTVCASCHRPESNFMLPLPPISAHVPAGDALLTGRNAEAQGDPRSPDLFENHGLVKQRMNRFNPLLRHPAADTEPDAYHTAYYELFTWRKTQTILNVAFGYGYLTDGRARSLLEQGRGAAFTHTQDLDIRFDDLVNPSLPDVAAWQQTQVYPAEVADLLNPLAPDYYSLTTDPFYTVHPTTPQQWRGEQVFADNCMSCHNMPNVFGNRTHIPGPPLNFPPLYGQGYDIGVAENNALNLDYRFWDATTNTFTPLVITLTRQDGQEFNVTVVNDVGAAGTTARLEDLNRFKVPQLRNIANLAPYFHDNSAMTLDEVVDYFNTDAYNKSPDGSQYPIHLNHQDHDALVAFLTIL